MSITTAYIVGIGACDPNAQLPANAIILAETAYPSWLSGNLPVLSSGESTRNVQLQVKTSEFQKAVTSANCPTVPATVNMIVSTGSTSTTSGVQPTKGNTQFPDGVPSSAAGTGTPANTSTPGSSNKSNGVARGTIAGVAIGGLLVGILLGALAIFFLCGGRRGKQRREGTENGHTTAYAADGKSGSTLEVPMDSATALVHNNLPQPVADTELATEYSRISDRINGHVQSFYGQGQVADHGNVAQAIAQVLGSGSGLAVGQLATLLASPSSRPAILRLTIGKILVSRMEVGGDAETSLLPAGTATTLSKMATVSASDGGKLNVTL
jgi:hypothetical protein